jgi:hypothetical protein
MSHLFSLSWRPSALRLLDRRRALPRLLLLRQSPRSRPQTRPPPGAVFPPRRVRHQDGEAEHRLHRPESDARAPDIRGDAAPLPRVRRALLLVRELRRMGRERLRVRRVRGAPRARSSRTRSRTARCSPRRPSAPRGRSR